MENICKLWVTGGTLQISTGRNGLVWKYKSVSTMLIFQMSAKVNESGA